MTQEELPEPARVETGSRPRYSSPRLADVAAGTAVLVVLVIGVPRICHRLLGPGTYVHLFIPLVILAEAWMWAFPVWISRRRGAPPFLPGAGIRRILVEGSISIPATFGLMVVFAAAAYLWGGTAIERPEVWQRLAQSDNLVYPAVLLLMSFTIVPFAEEIFFRGFIYGALRARCHVVIAVLAQATLFSVAHSYSAVHLVGVFVIGVFLATVYEWRRTLLAPIFVHMLFNFVAAVVLLGALVAHRNSPVLGVQIETHADGCRVTLVLPDSSAEEAGLAIGDVITSIDDTPVRTVEELIVLIRAQRVGDRVEVEFTRDGQSCTREAILGRRP